MLIRAKKSTLFGVTVVAVLVGVWLGINAGNLDPPGAPAPTMKTLQDAEPRTPIRNDFNTLTPIVISQEGSYYLAEDILAFPGAHGIEITASHVDLDLNGFSIIGNTEVGSLDGIHADGEQEIVVRDGSVHLFFEGGIDFGTSSYCRIENVRVNSNDLSGGLHVGIDVGIGGQVIDSTAADNGWFGIRVQTAGIISRSQARDNAGDGLVAGSGSIVESSVAYSNTGTGISGFFTLVRGNTAINNGVAINNLNGTTLENMTN